MGAMINPRACLQKAERLEHLAKDTQDDSSRATLLDIALRCRKMAADPAFQKVRMSSDLLN
jgi:hypothetical protein